MTDHKRCSHCNRPDSDGTLYQFDSALWCGTCLRNKAQRLKTQVADLRKSALNAMTAEGQCMEQHIWPGHPEYERLKAESNALKEAYGTGCSDNACCGDCYHRETIERILGRKP